MAATYKPTKTVVNNTMTVVFTGSSRTWSLAMVPPLRHREKTGAPRVAQRPKLQRIRQNLRVFLDERFGRLAGARKLVASDHGGLEIVPRVRAIPGFPRDECMAGHDHERRIERH